MQATQILEELQPHALALMTDQFGNYVIQKLLDHGGEDVRAALGKEIQGRVLELTVNTFGCRIVQKALEVCPSAHLGSIWQLRLSGTYLILALKRAQKLICQ